MSIENTPEFRAKLDRMLNRVVEQTTLADELKLRVPGKPAAWYEKVAAAQLRYEAQVKDENKATARLDEFLATNG